MKKTKIISTTLGLLTIPISAVLAVITLSLRGPLNFPLSEKLDWIEIIASSNYLLFQNLLLISYILPLIGFFVLYHFLAKDIKLQNIAHIGLIGAILGTALALPASGIVSYVTPFAMQLDAAGQVIIGQAVNDAVLGKGMWVGIVSAVLYTIGPLLLGMAMWRHTNISRVGAVLFIIHGGLLSFGFSFFPLLLIGWGLLVICGILLCLDIWKVAKLESQS